MFVVWGLLRRPVGEAVGVPGWPRTSRADPVVDTRIHLLGVPNRSVGGLYLSRTDLNFGLLLSGLYLGKLPSGLYLEKVHCT